MAGFAELAARTPARRNRAVDLYRVVALTLVVLGHWLGAAIWEQPSGSMRYTNLLTVADWTHWVTWIVQVMPVFFIVGGYSNYRSLEAARRDGTQLSQWMTQRLRRLLTPLGIFIGVWVALAVATRLGGVDPDLIRDGSDQATVPLWFLAVYLLAVAAAPMLLAAWRRWGVATLVVGLIAVVAVDVVRLAGDIEVAGWLNYGFVFLTAHQAGYWWADRHRAPGRGVAAATGAIGLATLWVLTVLGPYPVSMVAVPPRSNFNNALPPTVPMLALALAQFGLMLVAEPAARRAMLRARAWIAVVAANSVVMTVYLWHLTAVVLVVLVGILTDVGFGYAPLGRGWWLTRIPWLAALSVALLAIIAVFGRYENRIRQDPGPRPILGAAGGVAAVVAIAATVEDGLVDVQGNLRWWVVALYAAAIVIWKAVPARNQAVHVDTGPA